ncbi:ricin-type beta-trefoil lectin domain protein [Streptomyces sp. PTY087I2]|uniref:ricin-type beta-trefoil lectin domain protein n=1 Tax=Streptomyces sp. PTY087I2 TaxID=1819298 RepID=UPI00080BF39D|nr:ricin-type beta-trefoil lectin domain protein [Streptomyces sp. PTY087I2]OCC12729.1 Serine protease 1 precursor [Streptomyces sp. PTY087I2]
MTRSPSPQSPASAPARAGAETEAEAAEAEKVPEAETTPQVAKVLETENAKGAEEGEKTEKAEEAEEGQQGKRPEVQASQAQAPEAQTPEAQASEAPTPQASHAPDAPATTPGATTSDPEADPSASAAAQSRLPALVRTMTATATAIGRPQQEAGPVGRPGKAALAGAAVVGALLVSVPFLVLAGNNDDGPERTKAAGAGTVLDGSGPEAPGEFAVTAPGTSAPADTDGERGEEKREKSGNPVPAIPPADGSKAEAKKDDGPEDPPKKADPAKEKSSEKAEEKGKTESGGSKNQPAKAQPAVTFSGPVSFRSHLSGRCLDVPGHNFNDGQPLFMWDCNGADAQKWRFGSDGTIRARDKCLDVANANFANGSRIQLAWCNGSAAQKFTLNGAHDLVNTVVGKCVDIPNHSKGRGPETYLILWECTGLDNQKWST